MIKKYGQQLIYIAIGFILGCMVTDSIRLDTEIKSRQSSYDYARLILSSAEKPKRCPYCGEEYNYFYDFDESELQSMIDRYLGKEPY